MRGKFIEKNTKILGHTSKLNQQNMLFQKVQQIYTRQVNMNTFL